MDILQACARWLGVGAPPQTTASSGGDGDDLPADGPSPEVTAPVLDDPMAEVLRELRVVSGRLQGDDEEKTIRHLLDVVEAGRLDLPPLPSLATRLMALDLDGPEDSGRLAALLQEDQEVASSVMEAANQSFFGQQPAETLELAVVRLGLSSVQQIAIGASVAPVVYRIPGYVIEAQRLRDDARQAALCCQALSRVSQEPPGTAYLAGLFHDVGRVLILQVLSQARVELGTRRASEVFIDLLDRHLHVPLGVLFASEHNMPQAVTQAIAFHHEPRDRLSALVWAIQALQGDEPLSDDDWSPLAPPIDVARKTLSAA